VGASQVVDDVIAVIECQRTGLACSQGSGLRGYLAIQGRGSFRRSVGAATGSDGKGCHYGKSTYQGGLSLPGSGVTSDVSKVQKRLSDARQVDPVKF
jgi:hypothetical protein